MIFESIVNRGEFFSNHYLDAVIGGDLGDLRGTWKEIEEQGETTARRRITGMRPGRSSRPVPPRSRRRGRTGPPRWAELNDVRARPRSGFAARAHRAGS